MRSAMVLAPSNSPSARSRSPGGRTACRSRRFLRPTRKLVVSRTPLLLDEKRLRSRKNRGTKREQRHWLDDYRCSKRGNDTDLRSKGSTRFYKVLQGSTRFYKVLRGSTRFWFYEVLRGSAGSLLFDLEPQRTV